MKALIPALCTVSLWPVTSQNTHLLLPSHGDHFNTNMTGIHKHPSCKHNGITKSTKSNKNREKDKWMFDFWVSDTLEWLLQSSWNKTNWADFKSKSKRWVYLGITHFRVSSWPYSRRSLKLWRWIGFGAFCRRRVGGSEVLIRYLFGYLVGVSWVQWLL